ncbi:Carbon starvation induced protein CsiD [Bacillus thermotolerans]|uniref:Carbon starvation induced protein CsiD n=2 Tax=Bacillus thermotolerans TaxID=1221996 RepID=A0A0F5HYD3_BACTR|nr:Carbon starvation induced protein CsiD [Bacillus thermotolerans]KKB39805.1 Carbon starvation induced protein CsiD [Bacillus thermotolerans]
MMSTVANEEKKFIRKTAGYEVKPHPQSDRLYHLELDRQVIRDFFAKIKAEDISVQHLEYTPYARRIVAYYLLQLAGEDLQDVLRGIIQDRESGGFTIGLRDESLDTDDYVIFSTALSHIVGTPNFDAMTGKYYARFTVAHTDNSDSYLRQAYRRFTLHTDGTFVDEPTDWLLMMKMKEENAKGGESRLLHLDDWAELEKFSTHPLANYKFTYKAPSSKNVGQEIERTTFFKVNDKPCICFIDQFAYPETIDQAKYLKELSDSMENDKSVIELELPVGDLVMLNNLFWLHGRAAFEVNPDLDRELLRQRGCFASI